MHGLNRLHGPGCFIAGELPLQGFYEAFVEAMRAVSFHHE